MENKLNLDTLTKEIFLAMVTGNPGTVGRVDLAFETATKAAKEYISLQEKKSN
jgi:hypothetical protein